MTALEVDQTLTPAERKKRRWRERGERERHWEGERKGDAQMAGLLNLAQTDLRFRAPMEHTAP